MQLGRMSAFAVAIGCKADMACLQRICLLLTQSGHGARFHNYPLVHLETISTTSHYAERGQRTLRGAGLILLPNLDVEERTMNPTFKHQDISRRDAMKGGSVRHRLLLWAPERLFRPHYQLRRLPSRSTPRRPNRSH